MISHIRNLCVYSDSLSKWLVLSPKSHKEREEMRFRISELRRRFLYSFLPEIGLALEKAEIQGIPEPLPPETQFYGKQCPECKVWNIWAFVATTEVKIQPMKIKEKCSKCGLPGSKYIDGRGYVYFQHYREGKRRVCYIGKIQD